MPEINTAILLVVDDDDAGRYVKVQTLRRAGFEVHEAPTGGEGLALVETLAPDLVVLDVNLPDVSGLEVSRRIRAGHGAPPAIQILQISSTAVGSRDRVRGLEHGADVYLTEPVEPEVLIATVQSLLRVRRAETALAEALERERAARRIAEEASRLRDEFIAMLSHELRTPLNALMGWIWQLRRSSLNADAQARALDSLERNAQLQAQLINDLLDVSRISKGKLPLELRRLDLLTVVADAVDSVRDQAARKSLQVAVSGESSAVIADQGRLLQIVGNLLTNAVQFTPDRGVIAVTTSREGGEAVLCVRDTGAGIDPAFLPNVFDQFRQGTGGLSRKHGGLGLGLAVVRQLTELHGGSVSVVSAGLGYGATFMLRLPREEGADAESPPAGPILRGVRVLIVAAGEDDGQLLKGIVEASGATPMLTPSAEEGAARVHDAAPDALVVDAETWAASQDILTRALSSTSDRSIVRLTVRLPPQPADMVRQLVRALATRSASRIH